MKILVIGRSFPEKETGMIGVFELEQAMALKTAGQEVRYFFCDTRSIFRIQRINNVEMEYEGLKVSGCYMPVGRLPYPIYAILKERRFIKELKLVIKDFEPDIVHIHYPTIMLTEQIWSYIRSIGCPIVVTEHFTKVMLNKLSNRQNILLTKVAKEADRFICVSDKLRKSVEHISNIKDKVIVIPNMVNSDFAVSEQKNNGDIVFTYVGAARKVKQVDKLIKAFMLLEKEIEHSTMRIVGDGPTLNKAKRITKSFGIERKVKFYGNVSRSRVAELLGETDFFITASRVETFCVPIIESWCCGIPTIVPDSMPILSFCNEQNSVVFKDSDVKDMVAAMKNAIERKKLYDPLYISEQAKKIFGHESVVSEIIKVYIDVLGRRNS